MVGYQGFSTAETSHFYLLGPLMTGASKLIPLIYLLSLASKSAGKNPVCCHTHCIFCLLVTIALNFL